MKPAITITVSALVIGTLLFKAYMTIGWHYFDMPYPDVIAPTFHLDGESHEDAVFIEVWLEIIAATAVALIGARFVLRRPSN